MTEQVPLTGVECFFDKDEFIVSKTDLKGRLTYANDVFIKISGYTEAELLGAPHNILRHPDMPHCVFKLLWDTIEAKKEIFAYVINRCKNGDYYWVQAHVTPSFDTGGNHVGYHSNRRVVDRALMDSTIAPLYAELSAIEQSTPRLKDGMEKATNHLISILSNAGVSYDAWFFSLAA